LGEGAGTAGGEPVGGAGLEHAKGFAEQLVLQYRRGHVVEHGAADGAREFRIRERHIGGIALNHRYIAAPHSVRKGEGERRIDFECGEVWEAWA
jgi:hypothetical protein